MDYVYETIKTNGNFPVKLFVHRVNYVQNHWHECIELLFVLSGKLNIAIGNASYELKEDDIIVVNPREIHATSSREDNIILALQIPSDVAKSYCDYMDGVRFNCKSFVSAANHQKSFDRLRAILAEMLLTDSRNEDGFELKLQSLLLELLHILYRNFRMEAAPAEDGKSEKYSERLSKLIYYINENYASDISLNSLAKKEYLSVSYLSRFFKRYAGKTFLDYLNSIRLEHAVKELIYTDNPISQILLRNGFPNEISFLKLFKNVYGETPSQYRKKAKDRLGSFGMVGKASTNYFEVISDDIFKHVFKYLKTDATSDRYDIETVIRDLGTVDVKKAKTGIRHSWKNLITIGKAKEGLFAEVQSQLRTIRKEIGFRYVRFHGIFDDEMMVYQEDREGNPILNFSYTDSLIVFLLSIGLKPFIELGFMPGKLARSQNTIFYKSSYISMPKDMQKWCFLVRSFLLHCFDQFGKHEVEQWHFEFWNEPDMTGMFWHDSEEEYLEFFRETYSAVKEVSENLLIGGPATVISNERGFKWIGRFIQYGICNNCKPDFLTFHFYPDAADSTKTAGDPFSLHRRTYIPEDENLLSNALDKLRETAGKYGYRTDQMHMTEWNSTAWHRDLTNDTCYKAAYIVKNIVENMDCAASFGYWTMTDLIEEQPASSRIFHGGLGVFTRNGIKKAGYHAFRLLSKLGNHFIHSGKGVYITSDDAGYQVLLYDYCHFDRLYCMRDLSRITESDRYNVFTGNCAKEINLVLTGLEEGAYEIREHSVNREYGSAFDNWVGMGSPEYLSDEELEHLRSGSSPFYRRRRENLGCVFKISTILAPHEIRLYEIKQIGRLS